MESTQAGKMGYVNNSPKILVQHPKCHISPEIH